MSQENGKISGQGGFQGMWHLVFDSITDLIFIQDADYRFLKVNKAVCDLLKVKESDLIGKKCYEVLHKSDHPWPDCPFVRTLKDKKPSTGEVHDRRHLGVPLLVTTSPILNEKGELVAIVHVAKDISELDSAREGFKALFDDVADALFLHDKSGKIVDVNRKSCEMTGYTREELLKMTVFDIEIGFQKEMLDGAWEEMKDEPKVLISRHRHKDGLVSDVEIVVNKFTFQGRQLLLASVRDITERQKAQAAILESEERFKTVFGVSPVCTSLTGLSDGKFLDVNAAFERVTGYKKEEVMGKTATGLNLWAQPEERARIEAVLTEKGFVNNFESQWRIKTGELINITFDASLLNVKGKAYILGLVTDITERKKVEEELNKRIRDLVRFQKVTMGREERILELKKRIKELERLVTSDQ